MKKTLLLIGFLQFSMMQAQLQRPVMNAELSAYFKFVNLAARAIHADNFPVAAQNYEEAFRHKPVPFFADLKNAFIVNSKCGLHEKNLVLLKFMLRDKGMDSAQVFRQLPRRIFDASGLDFVRNFREKPKPGTEIFKKAFYNLYESYQADLNTTLPHDHTPERFFDLYAKYGFPSEEKIGCLNENGEEIWSGINNIVNGITYSKGQTAERMMKILQTEFENGNIPPSVLANCYDYAHQNLTSRKAEYYFQNELLAMTGGKVYRPFIYYTDSVMQVINTNRVSIGLDSFHVVQKQYVTGKFCTAPECSDPSKISIQTVSYISNPQLPYGFVKAAFEKEKQDMSWYLMDVQSIASRCNCGNKQY
jgi:hypothetical protein